MGPLKFFELLTIRPKSSSKALTELYWSFSNSVVIVPRSMGCLMTSGYPGMFKATGSTGVKKQNAYLVFLVFASCSRRKVFCASEILEEIECVSPWNTVCVTCCVCSTWCMVPMRRARPSSRCSCTLTRLLMSLSPQQWISTLLLPGLG